MPKSLYEIKDFSGGLNAYADPRDIDDSQFSQNWNAVVDKNGILRVIGSAVESIYAKRLLNDNIQTGFGLFQFATDYGWNLIDGSFDLGFESGTVAAIEGAGTGASSSTEITLEETSTLAADNTVTYDDYYKGMTIFIYSGTGAGQSRRISAYDASEKKIQVTEAFDTGLSTSSKYMIFRWMSYGFDTNRTDANADTTHVEDFITDGNTSGFFQATDLDLPSSEGSSSSSQYYAVSKQASISAEASEDLGYLEYIKEDEGNLKLKAGVTYLISFQCAFKNKYYSDISDGDADGSALGTGDLVPNIELYSPTVTNGTTNQESSNTGLYLQANNRWCLKGLQSDYAHTTKSYANYAVNGDGRDSFASPWTVGGSRLTVTNDSTQFNGTDGTFKISWDANNITGASVSTDYLQLEVTLDTDTWYHLDYQYIGGVILPRIYDNTDSQFIMSTNINGQTYPYSFIGSEDDDEGDINNHKWCHPGEVGTGVDAIQLQGGEISGGGGSYDYIRFYIPSGDSSTKTIHIRLSPALSTFRNFGIDNGANKEMHLHGVTLYKARNDLVSMGYKKPSTVNPFLGQPLKWSTYTTKFQIPGEYNDASDWIFRIRGGRYSCGEGTMPDGTSAVNNQEVYIANVSISDNNGDVFTMLSSLDENRSSICLNSKNQGRTWNKGFIELDETNAQPNFNYSNGVLKISDGNFKTNNPNMLMYYDTLGASNITTTQELAGWKTKNGFLTTPPSIVFQSIELDYSPIMTGDLPNNGVFDAIPKQNEIFNGMYFTTPGGTNNSSIETNWRYDCFGPQTDAGPEGMGLITRYIEDDDFTYLQLVEGDYQGRAAIASYDSFTQSPPNKVSVTSAGIGTISLTGSGHSDSGGHSNEIYRESMQPIKAIIRQDDLLDFIGNANASRIASIDFEIVWEFQGCKKNNAYDGPKYAFPNYNHLPWFNVRAGWYPQINTSQYQDVVNKTGSFSDGWESNLNNEREINFGYNNWVNQDRWKDLFFNNIEWQAYPGEISLNTPVDDFYLDTDGNATHRTGGQVMLSGTLNWENNNTNGINIANDGDIIFLIQDNIDDAGQSQVWGTQGILERDINEWDTSSPNTRNLRSESEDKANFTRFFVNKLDVTFYDDGPTQDGFNPDDSIQQSIVDGSNVEVLLTFNTPNEGTSPSGWGERTFDVAVSVVDIFDCESYLNVNSNATTSSVDATLCPEITFIMGNSHWDNHLIKQTKIYMKSNDSDIWYLQWYVNHKGPLATRFYSTTSGNFATLNSSSSNCKRWFLNREHNKIFNEVNSYESETMVTQDDAIGSGGKLTCRYKTSVVANNRLYVGNIEQNGIIHGDRMIKSPINKYNILPASNFIDVAINDGDEITALEYFQDKLLQFKKQKVFVINISGDYESLENTFENVGVNGQYSVTKTPYGIIWANASGCYLYDGEKLTNLIEGRIATSESYANPGVALNRWAAGLGSSGDCVIGYDRNKDTILVNFSKDNNATGSLPTGATYHFKTDSWTLILSVWTDHVSSATTGDMTNMVTSNDGDILFYHSGTPASGIGANTLRKWNHGSSSDLATKLFTFTTKDITFGNINVRKKVYGIYVTYRVRSDGSDSGVNVTAAINGSNSFTSTFSSSSKFAYGQSNSSGTSCYSDASGTLTLNETDGIWKTAYLKPATPSEFNNISSIMFQFSGGTTAYDFEINDISVVYRTKKIK